MFLKHRRPNKHFHFDLLDAENYYQKHYSLQNHLTVTLSKFCVGLGPSQRRNNLGGGEGLNIFRGTFWYYTKSTPIQNTAFHCSMIGVNFVLEESRTVCGPETVPPVSCPSILFVTSYIFMLQVTPPYKLLLRILNLNKVLFIWKSIPRIFCLKIN